MHSHAPFSTHPHVSNVDTSQCEYDYHVSNVDTSQCEYDYHVSNVDMSQCEYDYHVSSVDTSQCKHYYHARHHCDCNELRMFIMIFFVSDQKNFKNSNSN